MRHRDLAWLAVVTLAAGLTAGGASQVAGQRASLGEEEPRAGIQQHVQQMNMRLVGLNDLQARSAYQPIIHQHPDGRWIAYIGHHGGAAFNPLTGVEERNGTSIVDVTDPRHPRYLEHIPGPAGVGEQGGAQMVRACKGSELPNADDAKVYLLRATATAHEVWDVTDPARPGLVKTVIGNLGATHKNWWECDTGIAYLVSDGRRLDLAVSDRRFLADENWRTNRMTQIYDLSNPASPVFIRNYGLVGQQPGSTGDPVPTGVHGGISLGPAVNRVYFGHGTGANGIFQIVDRQKLLTGAFHPTKPTQAELLAPQIGRLDTAPSGGAHTVFPVLEQPVPEFATDAHGRVRDFVVLVNESVANRCLEPRQLVYLVDVTRKPEPPQLPPTESKPMVVANFQVPEASGNFCDRGGRFGAHASNESFTPTFYGKLVFVSWFNAGVRAIDIREPYSPREVGFFIPATTANTEERCAMIDGREVCQFAIQTNNVEVDERGFIYIVDRANTGLHILELTGEAREIIAE
jgi:hypothetical protein